MFLLLGGVVLCGSSALAQSRENAAQDLLIRWHFIGSTQLAEQPQAAKLREVWAVPSAEEFRKEILGKISLLPLMQVENRAENRAKLAPLLHPLFEDLMRAESVFEARQEGAEFILAIQLEKKRAQLWEANLRELLKGLYAATVREIERGGFKGWEAQTRAERAPIQVLHAGSWLLVHRSGSAGLWIDQIKEQGRPVPPLQENWFSGELDLGEMRKISPEFARPLKACRMHVALAHRGENIRMALSAVFPEKLDWKPARWQIPTEIIRDPVRSFTAAQRLSVLVETPDLFRAIGFNPLEQQIYTWSQVFMPFQSFFAISVQDSTNQMKRLIATVPKEMNPILNSLKSGEVQPGTNQLRLAWQGLPLLLPQLRATNETAGAFIYGELFPPFTSKEPLPPELIQQIAGRTNLLYYHWEITQDRLSHWNVLSQLLPFFPNQRFMGHAPRGAHRPDKGSGHKWLEEVTPMLGNTGTEITLAAPNEVQVVRQSHVGLTGFELVWLTNWLLDPAFPGITRPQPNPTPAQPSPRPGPAKK